MTTDLAQSHQTGNRFTVKFWGVRGTIATPGTRTIRYGGNTSCVEMRCNGHVLIFDAGTGIYALGEALDHVKELDLFLSHTHVDHVLGFPFFSPAYNPDKVIRVWAGHLLEDGNTVRDALAQLMSPPLFPLTLDFLKADITYNDFLRGESPPCDQLKASGIDIQTLPLNHPDNATGYRVTYGGHSACYITDIEHRTDGMDEALIAFIRDADLLIYDSTYDDRDFDKYVGWGHSTWQHAVRLAEAANVKTLTLFHHDPGCTDDDLDKRAEELKAIRPNDYVAHEGLIIRLA